MSKRVFSRRFLYTKQTTPPPSPPVYPAKDGDRAPPAGMPAETWARGPPEARDRDRDGGGFRAGGGGGMGGFRPPPGTWAERREVREGGGKDYGGGGGMKDFVRDRADREKDLEKWGKVRCAFGGEDGWWRCWGGGGYTRDRECSIYDPQLR